MSTSVIRGIIVIGALLVLGSVNYSIYDKEHIKGTGELIYLELAPLDPRSLMQGDYMALRFALAAAIESARRAEPADSGRHDGTVTLQLDERHVATLSQADSNGALRIRYRIRSGRVWLGTNAFFFEEGSAERFAPARYGEFRIDRESGEAVLVGLRDAELNRL